MVDGESGADVWRGGWRPSGRVSELLQRVGPYVGWPEVRNLERVDSLIASCVGIDAGPSSVELQVMVSLAKDYVADRLHGHNARDGVVLREHWLVEGWRRTVEHHAKVLYGRQ